MAKITYVFDTENEEDKMLLCKLNRVDDMLDCIVGIHIQLEPGGFTCNGLRNEIYGRGVGEFI